MSKETQEKEVEKEQINTEIKEMSKPIEAELDEDDDYDDFEEETESIRYHRRLYALMSMAEGISKFFGALSSLSNPYDI